MSSFTREQWLTILTFVVVNFFNAMCASMQVRHNQSFYCSTTFKTNAFLNILTLVIVNFLNAMCASSLKLNYVNLQAPFYPREAAKKGLEVYAFGLVFGTFEV